jgi:hypothetical protein
MFKISIIFLVLLTTLLNLPFMACKGSMICQLEREGRKCLKLMMSDTVTEVPMALCVFCAMAPCGVVNL